MGFLSEVWELLLSMSAYLLLGFLIAGFLRAFIPPEKIYEHFSGSDLSSIVKASLFGVPLPLCSCGIIPVAALLRKEGCYHFLPYLNANYGRGFHTCYLFAFRSAVCHYKTAVCLCGGVSAGILTSLLEKKGAIFR